MTCAQLIEEGRKLQRACSFLRPQANGPVAAIWHERDKHEIQCTGHHCWLTVDVRHVPGLPTYVTGYVSVFTNEKGLEGGYVQVTSSWPKRPGIPLYAYEAGVLPPIDAVFTRGSDAVGEWIRSYGWERGWGYNDNFKGRDVIREYERVQQREFPIYFESDIYAVLGGWHFPMPDGDWDDLLDEHLMVFTIRDSEPWVEAWRTQAGQFRVIQRIT